MNNIVDKAKNLRKRERDTSKKIACSQTLKRKIRMYPACFPREKSSHLWPFVEALKAGKG